jgi:hypothetical protein
MNLTFDPAQSSLRIETIAKGMLAKLAHDLAIDAKTLTAAVTHEGGKAELTLRVPIADLKVYGVRKGGTVDTSVLSGSDRADIERKIRSEVLKGEAVVAKLSCEAALDPGKRTVNARGTVEVGGRSTPVSSGLELDSSDATVTVKGRVRVSLPSLGISPPKGPLGAFRVDDDVEVVVSLRFTRE